MWLSNLYFKFGCVFHGVGLCEVLKRKSWNGVDWINILLWTFYAYEYNFSVECGKCCDCIFHQYMYIAVRKVNL
jgi:hypothetical protein